MMKYLHSIEEESAYYNLKLHKGKCLTISMNANITIKFKDGKALENVDKAKYLGVYISKKSPY